MILTGKIKSGLNEASFWVKKIENVFKEKENIKLFPGTLNIELDENFKIQAPDFIIEKEEYGGTEKLYIKKCNLLGEKAYIIRTAKNSTENGDHPLNIIEILSDVYFREKYNLKEGSKIEILI